MAEFTAEIEAEDPKLVIAEFDDGVETPTLGGTEGEAETGIPKFGEEFARRAAVAF